MWGKKVAGGVVWPRVSHPGTFFSSEGHQASILTLVSYPHHDGKNTIEPRDFPSLHSRRSARTCMRWTRKSYFALRYQDTG